jgi:hypothetical protein
MPLGLSGYRGLTRGPVKWRKVYKALLVSLRRLGLLQDCAWREGSVLPMLTWGLMCLVVVT